VKRKLRAHFDEFPGAEFQFQESNRAQTNDPIDIVVHIDDLVQGKQIGDQIVKMISKIPGVVDAQSGLKNGEPQYDVIMDRDKMYSLGIDVTSVGNELNAAVNGAQASYGGKASSYRYLGNLYDLDVRLQKSDRNALPKLDEIFCKSSLTGTRIPLSSFCTYRLGFAPMTITRENQDRVVHITANFTPDAKTNVVNAEIRKEIRENIPIQAGMYITYEGDNYEMTKLMTRFILIIAVAIFLVFGVMAAQFESFKDPFIILLTIPLSLIGVVTMYLIVGKPFSLFTAVGFLVLVGVIVNNGIVLVDYTNLLRKRGYDLHKACVEAARNRLRPILMSVLTTVLGLIPMAFAKGEGSRLVQPIGTTVLGGMTFGTLMTLFLMPTVYFLMNKNSERNAARRADHLARVTAGMNKKQWAEFKAEQAAKEAAVQAAIQERRGAKGEKTK
jgi:HAE1 family hydrophobic/amphiphilic exporter-1